MPASVETLSRYRVAVEGLSGAFSDLTSAATAVERAQPEVEDFDGAVDNYLTATQALFDETLDADPRTALASLGGDFRVLSELGATQQGPPLTAAADEVSSVGDFVGDMNVVLEVASGAEPGPARLALADVGDPTAGALAAINTISASGQAKLGAAVAAAIVPNVGQLGALVGTLLGGHAGLQFDAAMASLGGLTDRIARAATKLLRTVVDKVTALLGKSIGNEVEDWVERFFDLNVVYEEALRIPELRDEATSVLGVKVDAAARAALIATAARSHDSDQRWVGWGAKGLSWAGPKVNAVQPWGPAVVGLASVALVVLCVWLTEDYLDSYDVGWLPDRVPGVGAALA
jgi:hypothetical protein